MKRRTLLSLAAAGTASIAGCTDVGPGRGGDGTPTGTGSPTGTGTPTETDGPTGTPGDGGKSPTGTPADGGTGTPERRRVTDTDFGVLDTACGTGENSATVERRDSEVVVTGTVGGSDACYTAKLAEVSYDADTDELTVRVRAYRSQTDTACADCIVDVDYRATIGCEGGAPGTVTVYHDGLHSGRVTRDEA